MSATKQAVRVSLSLNLSLPRVMPFNGYDLRMGQSYVDDRSR